MPGRTRQGHGCFPRPPRRCPSAAVALLAQQVLERLLREAVLAADSSRIVLSQTASHLHSPWTMPTPIVECWKCGRVRTNQEQAFYRCKMCEKWYCSQHYFADRPSLAGRERLTACAECLDKVVASQGQRSADTEWRAEQRRRDVRTRISIGSAIAGIVAICARPICRCRLAICPRRAVCCRGSCKL